MSISTSALLTELNIGTWQARKLDRGVSDEVDAQKLTKTKGRLIYKAWAQDSPKVYDAIIKAINATAIHFNKATEIKKAA